MREVSVVNSRGENIQEKTEAFTGENWYTISEVNRQFDKYGKPTVETDLMGRSTMSQWRELWGQSPIC